MTPNLPMRTGLRGQRGPEDSSGKGNFLMATLRVRACERQTLPPLFKRVYLKAACQAQEQELDERVSS